MKKIKIKFIGFWNGFECENNIFHDILCRNWQVEVCSKFEEADVCFKSFFLNKTDKLLGKFVDSAKLTIFYSGENRLPVINGNQLLLSALNLKFENHIYFPNWMHTVAWQEKSIIRPRLEMRRFGRPIKPHELNNGPKFQNKKFRPIVSAVFKNRDELRVLSLEKIASFAKIIFAGPELQIDSKKDLLNQSDYNMCFENSIGLGYVTEKLLEAKVTGNVPIYYGAPLNQEIYNRDCCLNLFENDFDVECIFKNDHLASEILNKSFLKVDAVLFYQEIASKINNWIEEGLK